MTLHCRSWGTGLSSKVKKESHKSARQIKAKSQFPVSAEPEVIRKETDRRSIMRLKSRQLTPANNCSRTFKLVLVGLVYLRCPCPVQSRNDCMVWIQPDFRGKKKKEKEKP